MPPRNQHQADSQAGFAVGKTVWLKETFDGQRYAKTYGTSGVLAAKDRDAFGCRQVCFGDFTVNIPEEYLRLTPPRSLTGKGEKAKAAKPKERKEAIDPALGRETTIFDYLEG